jgi:DNA-binding transcriptional ArsR family regulator
MQPQRLAIVRALALAPATTAELGARLPEIAQASLYRHLAALAEAGIVHVVDERPVRGTVERTYALVAGSALISSAELAEVSTEQHERYFAVFLSGLIAEFTRYLTGGHPDFEADGVGYREHLLRLDDEQFAAFTADLRAVVARYSALSENPEQTERLFATVHIPAPRSTP